MFSQAVAQSGFRGLGSLGDARPSYDYVKNGDVVRVRFSWSNQLPAPVNAENAFRQGLQKYFNVVNVSANRGWTFNGDITADVQARSDYSRLADVVSIVLHEAQAAGLTVYATGAQGEFVSRVEDTGGKVPSSIPAPGPFNPGNVNLNGSGSNPLTDLVDNFTRSPISLAVIAGAAVLLILMAKK